MIKITYIVYKIHKSNEFEWLIEKLDNTKYELSFINIGATSKTSLETSCRKYRVKYENINYKGKRNILKAILQVKNILKHDCPDIVHAHLFEGGLIGITAAWMAKIKHRVYTRHYSDFHHEYAPKGLKYDRWINAKSTLIIAISEVVKSILIEKENVPEQKVQIIHHGLILEQFQSVSSSRINSIKKKYSIQDDFFIVGVVSRYIKLKGLQYIIPAFNDFLKNNPKSQLVLANARGPFDKEVKKLLSQLPKESYIEIKFEQDNAALFKTFDAFIHTPINETCEAFGQIYLESLASGVPSVFSKSGVGNELAEDKKNCIVVKHKNSNQITNALKTLINNKELSQEIVSEGFLAVENFTFDKKIYALDQLYFNLK